MNKRRKRSRVDRRRDIRARLLQEDARCAYCGCGLDDSTATLDHVIPRALGGPNHPSNIVLACGKCNRRKGCKPIKLYTAPRTERKISLPPCKPDVRE